MEKKIKPSALKLALAFTLALGGMAVVSQTVHAASPLTLESLSAKAGLQERGDEKWVKERCNEIRTNLITPLIEKAGKEHLFINLRYESETSEQTDCTLTSQSHGSPPRLIFSFNHSDKKLWDAKSHELEWAVLDFVGKDAVAQAYSTQQKNTAAPEDVEEMPGEEAVPSSEQHEMRKPDGCCSSRGRIFSPLIRQPRYQAR